MPDELIEPVPLNDIFAAGIADVEAIGHGMVRIWFFVKPGGFRIAVARIVLAETALPDIAEKIRMAIGGNSQ